MATPTNREELLELLRKSGVLKPGALEKFLGEHPQLPNDPKAVVSILLQVKLLTPFQAKLLLAGRYRGFRLGAYVLLEQLGQGGMGAVYLAEHDTLHRKAAIKVLPPGGNKITVERFLREARAAAALDHPNIVRLHDVGREGEVHFLVMEYVEGQTLDKLVSSSAPLPAQRAVEYVAQTCAGLQHAFERGFIHRDIKPANLILAKDGTIKILDMGLARSNEKHDQLTQNLDAGAIVGTADYISPEQAISNTGVDIRTDIYSLGATFFAIVTGRPPFSGPTASKLVQHQVKDPPSVTTLDRTFPKGLSAVIAKMMAKKPSDRYSTPSEVIDALEPWQNESSQLMAGVSQTLAGKTGSMNKMTGRLKAPEPPKKKKPGMLFAVLGGLAAALLLGIVIAVAMAFSGGGSQSQSKIGLGVTNPTTGSSPVPTGPASTTAPKVTPPTTKPAVAVPPDPPIPGTWLFTFDAGSVADFTVVKEKLAAVTGTDGKFPQGIYIQSYKVGSKTEFRRTDYSGMPVISMHTISGTPSGQMVFDLEDRMKLPLTPDKRYVATIEYAVVGKGAGVFTASGPAPKYVKLSTATLAPTMGKFLTKSVSFVRSPGIPARLAVDVQTAGSENAILIHRIELAEDTTSVPKSAPNRLLYNLELSDHKPCVITVQTYLAGAGPETKTQKELKRVPAGATSPPGWLGRSYMVNVACETEIAELDGSLALGIRTPKVQPPDNKPGSAILFSPRIECPGGAARLKFEYKSAISATKSTVKLKLDGQPPVVVAKLNTPTDGWEAHDQLLDFKKIPGGVIELSNSGEPGVTFWIRNFTITEADPSELEK